MRRRRARGGRAGHPLGPPHGLHRGRRRSRPPPSWGVPCLGGYFTERRTQHPAVSTPTVPSARFICPPFRCRSARPRRRTPPAGRGLGARPRILRSKRWRQDGKCRGSQHQGLATGVLYPPRPPSACSRHLRPPRPRAPFPAPRSQAGRPPGPHAAPRRSRRHSARVSPSELHPNERGSLPKKS
jgi:hypothetical protein